MAPLQRTESIPEDQRGAVFSGTNLVTAIRVRGVSFEHVLLPGKPKFSFGTLEGCDLCIEGRKVSHSHGLLERERDLIRVTDLASKNGIAFRGRNLQQFYIEPGDSFSIGDTVLYALNDEMRLQRPVIAEILGAQRVEAVDDLLMEAVHGSHVFLKAEPGSDQERLGYAIHNASLRRRHRFVVANASGADAPGLQHVKLAQHGTVLLRLDAGGTKLDPAFVEAVTQPEANIRLIVCARSLKEAIDGITEDVTTRTYRVDILSVRERPGEIPSLLERWFVDRQSPLLFSDFTDENQLALRAYRWPENLEEVRDTADRLAQLARVAPDASERQAAHEANIPRSNLKRWLDDLGLTLPLLRIPKDASGK